MQIKDISENQPLNSVDFTSADGWIIRAGTGQFNLREDNNWREFFNACVHAGKPLGLYWFAGHHDPRAEADFFHGLVGFLQPAQVHLGFWLDAETGQDAAWVDGFRAEVRLPWCGLYGSLNNFNNNYPEYMHFGLNWLAMPTGVSVPGGWSVPDHILLQDGVVGGIDHDVTMPTQPYPPAWA